MPHNSRRGELAFAAALGFGYVFCIPPLSIVATWIWTSTAQALYTGGWVSAQAFPFVIRMLGDLVTTLVQAIPFGLVLGLLARRSRFWSCISFFVAMAFANMLWVVLVPAPHLSGISLTDQLLWIPATQDFWIFPAAVVTVALFVWRWRFRHLDQIPATA